MKVLLSLTSQIVITSRPIWLEKNKNNNNKCKKTKFEFLIVDKVCQVTAEVRQRHKLTIKKLNNLIRQTLYFVEGFQ